MLVFARVSGLLIVFPGVSLRAVPVRVRLMLALAVTALIVPLADTRGGAYTEDALLLARCALELTVGLMLGLFCRMGMFILSTAGLLIAQTLSLSQIFGVTTTEDNNTTISTLLTMAGVAILFSSGFMIDVIGLLSRMYTELPLAGSQLPSLGLFVQRLVEAGSFVLLSAFLLSLPFIVMNVCYNLIIGILNRTMPQLMVTFVGLPAITLCGLILFSIFVQQLLEQWRPLVDDIIMTGIA